jgi:hypothetical protein
VKIIEVNADPTPLTQEGISDYLIQGKTGEVLPRIVEEAEESAKASNLVRVSLVTVNRETNCRSHPHPNPLPSRERVFVRD